MFYRSSLQHTERMRALYAVLFLVFVLSFLPSGRGSALAQSAPISKAPSLSQNVLSAPKEYIIGVEDVLDVSVWGETELSKTLAVSPEGTINYPLLGIIKVKDLTPEALEHLLRDRLSQGYLKDPKVTVAIKEFNSKKVMVFGLVGTPGLYKLKGEIPVLELLFMVGNVSKESGNRMVVMRRDPSDPQSQPMPALEVNLDDLLLKGDLSKNVMIKPGDVVYVTSSVVGKQRIYVMGEVRSAGPYDFTHSMTLLEAIKMAGGITDYAAPKRVRLIRKEGDKKVTFKFNLKEISSGKKSDDFIVQAGDVIIVPESWF